MDVLKPGGLFLLGHPCRETLDVQRPWVEIKVLRHGDNVMKFLKLDRSEVTGEEAVPAVEA